MIQKGPILAMFLLLKKEKCFVVDLRSDIQLTVPHTIDLKLELSFWPDLVDK